MTDANSTKERLQELIDHHISHDHSPNSAFLEIHGENELLIAYDEPAYDEPKKSLKQTWDEGNEKITDLVQENENITREQFMPEMVDDVYQLVLSGDWSATELFELFETVMNIKGATIEDVTHAIEKECPEHGEVTLEDF